MSLSRNFIYVLERNATGSLNSVAIATNWEQHIIHYCSRKRQGKRHYFDSQSSTSIMNVTRNRKFREHDGEFYSLTQYNHDFTLASCDPDGSHERSHLFVNPRIYCPRAPVGIKRAPNPVSHSIFVKYPKLEIHFETPDFDKLKKRTLREVKTCEKLLRPNPHHPNVAEYQGCIVIDGYIRGICFTRYETTLHDLVDPLPSTHKADFRYGTNGKRTLPKGRTHFLSTLRAGVAHIHSLGYVHNDLKPENVAVRRDGSAVVIDFDSVLRTGEKTKGVVPQTPEWHDPWKTIADPENDWDAVTDIEEWLGDREVKEFRFPGYEECLEIMGLE